MPSCQPAFRKWKMHFTEKEIGGSTTSLRNSPSQGRQMSTWESPPFLCPALRQSICPGPPSATHPLLSTPDLGMSTLANCWSLPHHEGISQKVPKTQNYMCDLHDFMFFWGDFMWFTWFAMQCGVNNIPIDCKNKKKTQDAPLGRPLCWLQRQCLGKGDQWQKKCSKITKSPRPRQSPNWSSHLGHVTVYLNTHYYKKSSRQAEQKILTNGRLSGDSRGLPAWSG